MKRRQTISKTNTQYITTLIWFSLFVSLFAIFFIGLLWWSLILNPSSISQSSIILGETMPIISPITITKNDHEITCMTDRPQTLENPYVPPVKKTDPYLVPIQTQSCRVINDYSQMGILVRKDHTDMILPLMGRKLCNRRDKFQYYAISNTGNINTKLPVRFKGQNGMSEYGCDEIISRDVVYVEGYKDIFEATIYENNSYIYDSYI